jgi:hypothetical protein
MTQMLKSHSPMQEQSLKDSTFDQDADQHLHRSPVERNREQGLAQDEPRRPRRQHRSPIPRVERTDILGPSTPSGDRRGDNSRRR